MADEERSQFLKDLNAESPLELVIRAHLWIESRMIELLCDLVPFPDRIDFDRFTFPQKVTLVAAHGALNKEDIPAYLKLNSMRNKVAHRLNSALNAEDEVALINCLSASLRDVSMIDEPKVAGKPWPTALRYVLAAMVTRLQVRRQVLRKERDQQGKLAAEVARLAQELREERERREAAGIGPSVPSSRRHAEVTQKGSGPAVKQPTDV
ncbi:hypothetical protein [Streptomyces scabiei]|uniref:hypothetical protein n=1 Tax=Streptomyces scabiei TaxID=1930 RepID=UPI00131C7DEE|nr:hypothetical protein [Streptomyces scabiei]